MNTCPESPICPSGPGRSRRPYRRTAIRVAVAAGGLGALAFTAMPAGASTSASASITAGSLGFVSTPTSVSFSDTLNGSNQSVTASQAFDVGDATGSGTGWNVTATSTTFSATGGHTLPTTAVSVTGAPSVACDASTTCTSATNAIAYPYVLPAGTTAPTATKLWNAAANTGMGNQTVTASFTLAVPGNTYAGSYSSTWTYSLVSAP